MKQQLGTEEKIEAMNKFLEENMSDGEVWLELAEMYLDALKY